jgi:predicted RND superfamily exporter protein
MSRRMENIDRFAVALTDWVVRRPWLVIVATLLIVAVLASGGRHLGLSNNYRVFFSPENPDLVAFENFQQTYTKNDNILFILQPGDGVIFSSGMLKAIEDLTAKAWRIPYAIRVDSITNFQHSWADGDDLTVEDLVRNAEQFPAEALREKQAVALAEPLLRGNLISPDADTTGINVTLQYPEESLDEVPEATAFARNLVTEIRKSYPDLHVALSGISMLNNSFADAGMKDGITLIPLMYLVLVAMTWLTLRSASATFATVLVIIFSTATALGVGGYMGIQLAPISITAPTIILTLAIADSVHILISMLTLMREGRDKITALKESLRINFQAVVITSLTTIVGFLSLNFSDAPPFWDLGNLTAIGIASALLYSVTFLPAILTVLPVKVRTASVQGDSHGISALERLGRFVIRRYRPILVTTGVLAIALTALVPTIDLNDEWVKYFDSRIPFRDDAEFGIEHLNGIYPVEFSIEAEEAGGISEPEYLNRLEQFTAWLRQQPEVRHVYSYTDVIKRLNKNLHGDAPEWYRLPEERQLAAQYLLLYELSLPFGLDLNDRINIDKSATRVTATLDEISTAGVRAFMDRSQDWLRGNAPRYMWAKPTGATVMFSFISERNIEGMLAGNAMAVFLIVIIMIVSLRSFSLGTMSLLPNTIPILMTFGVWALLVGEVGMAAATVSATSLGIVVDSTVHFLSKYLRARREKGLDRPAAILHTYRTVGLAIVVNSLILSFGFAVLSLSAFRVNAQMGLLTAIAIVIALAVDFFLLPALLLVGHKAKKGKMIYEKAILEPVS